MTITDVNMMSLSINKNKKHLFTYTTKEKGLLCTQGLNVCHAHNMKKNFQRELSSYLKRPREDPSSYLKRSRDNLFITIEGIVLGIWPTYQMTS